MLRSLLTLTSTFILTMTAISANAYYSHDSYEGKVTFTGMTQIADMLTDDAVRQYILQQHDYLAGPLQALAKKAGPKNDAQITITEKFRDASGRLMARYQYVGTMVLDKAITSTLTIRLPVDFSTIWENSTDACFSEANHRNAYFWNPVQKGCPLKENVDYFTFQASVSPLPNTTNTMPAYERLLNAHGEIRATLVFGADQDQLGMQQPDNNKDYNAPQFLTMRKYFAQQGFSRQIIPQDARERECGKSLATAPGHVEEFVRQDKAGKVVVRMFWGVVNLGDESSAFYCTLKHGVENGSILLYAGHSRVGGLDLNYMSYIIGQPIVMNPNQYQIFGFFGCSSYSYYNRSYFAARASGNDPSGTINTDIVTNGIAGSFYSMADFNIKTLTPILNWTTRGQKASWQQIIGSYPSSFLTGVNGDE